MNKISGLDKNLESALESDLNFVFMVDNYWFALNLLIRKSQPGPIGGAHVLKYEFPVYH